MKRNKNNVQTIALQTIGAYSAEYTAHICEAILLSIASGPIFQLAVIIEHIVSQGVETCTSITI